MKIVICLLSILVLALGGCSKNSLPYQPVNFSEDLLKKAEAGDPKAQLQIAGAYEGGRGIEKNLDVSLEWLKKSASQGYPLANTALGAKYLEGIGVNKDPKKALELFQLAADKGCVGGQYNLGSCYYNGYGVSTNDQEAFRWIKKAAEQKNPEAINLLKPKPAYILGQLYEKGQGCEKNISLALKWYERAASQGDEQSEKMVKILQKKPKSLFSKFVNRLKPSADIDGTTFVQFGIVGLASYHFNLKKGSYINYENRPKEWKYDDGSALSDKVYFKEEKYDPKLKEFNAYVVFEKPIVGVRLAEFKLKFDDLLKKIVSGKIQTYDSCGNPIKVKSLLVAFGDEPTKDLVYKRYDYPSTNPQ